MRLVAQCCITGRDSRPVSLASLVGKVMLEEA